MKIYNLFPLVAGKITEWENKLGSIKEMGFNYIYINPIFQTGYSRNLYAPKNFYEFSDMIVDENSPLNGKEQLADFIEKAHNMGLKIILEVILTHTSIDSDLLLDHPEWYYYKDDGELKKYSVRNENTWIEWGDLLEINNNPKDENTKFELWKFWETMLFNLLDLKVDMIKFHSAYKLPQELLKHLMKLGREKYSEVLFIGDNLGANFSDMLDLAHLGFDYLFSSLKWWNFHSTWFLEQHYKLKDIVKLISFPENHDTERVAKIYDSNENASKSWYALCALINEGVMIPTGFERGSVNRLSEPSLFGYDNDYTLDIREFIGKINSLKSEYQIFNEENDIYYLDHKNPNVFALKKISKSKDEFAIIIANLNFDNNEFIRLDDIFYIIENEDVIDISLNDKEEITSRCYEKELKPGEVRVLYTKKRMEE